MAKFLINLISFLWVIMLFFLSCKEISYIISLLIFFGVVVANVVLYGFVKKILDKKVVDNLSKINKIYPIYNEYTASYFAVCVAVFSLNFLVFLSPASIAIICLFLFLVFHMNNIGFLNPFLYIIGKRIYKIETNDNNFVVILDEKIVAKGKKDLDNLVKIDENVFFHKEKK